METSTKVILGVVAAGTVLYFAGRPGGFGGGGGGGGGGGLLPGAQRTAYLPGASPAAGGMNWQSLLQQAGYSPSQISNLLQNATSGQLQNLIGGGTAGGGGGGGGYQNANYSPATSPQTGYQNAAYTGQTGGGYQPAAFTTTYGGTTPAQTYSA